MSVPSTEPVRELDEYSLAALPLKLSFNGTALSTASSFTWTRNGRHYLVTNWHVFSGRHPDTGKHLADHAGEPNQALIRVNVRDFLGTKVPWPVPLRDPEDNPLWLVHPTHWRRVDIAILPLEPPYYADMRPINEMPSVPARVFVGSDVFVLGFPSLGREEDLPIWKRASIASEPQIKDPREPMLIDTATRPGMSGAPVVFRSMTGYVAEDGGRVMGITATRFVGVYSGRLSVVDQMDAQIGMVWPASLIDEIIDGNQRDEG
jgi:hypothetical protein